MVRVCEFLVSLPCDVNECVRRAKTLTALCDVWVRYIRSDPARTETDTKRTGPFTRRHALWLVVLTVTCLTSSRARRRPWSPELPSCTLLHTPSEYRRQASDKSNVKRHAF